MARAGAVLLGCMVLMAAGGLCRATEVLRGLRGQRLSFPALRPVAEDIVRIMWTSQKHSTHIAEAKPREKVFSVDFLPSFQGRLHIHHSALALEIVELRSGDGGQYQAVLDISSSPSSPKTFSYLVVVLDHLPGTTDGGDADGRSGSTTAQPGTEHRSGGETTPGPGRGQPPGAGGGPGVCGVQGGYCVLRGYLVGAILGPLVLLVVAVHVVTRD